MTLFWKRKIIVNIPQAGLTISDPKIAIDFKSEVDSDEPPSGTIHIYNLRVSTQELLRTAGTEAYDITVAAGYGEVTPIIFIGTISKTEMTRDGTEHRTTLRLNSMINAVHRIAGITSRTYSKNTPVRRIISDIAGIDIGMPIGSLEIVPADLLMPHQISYSGSSRAALSSIARAADITWYEENGRIRFNKPGAQRADIPALVINSRMGMVDVPSITEDGYIVKSLMQPHATLGGIAHLDSLNTGAVSGKIVRIHHAGDNWDGDFRTELELREILT